MDKLEEAILEYRGKKFVVIEPGGNNGDLLIYMGMKKKLKELGINCTFFRYKESPSPIYSQLWQRIPWHKITKILSIAFDSSKHIDVVIGRLDREVYGQTVKLGKTQFDPAAIILIHGGANINDIYGHGIHLLKNVIFYNPESIIIVAPQSYWFWQTNLSKIFLESKQEVYLFCRERYSYKLLRSMSLPKNVHVGLSHDTTFYLSKKDFHPLNCDYDLICFRTDGESILSQKAIDQIRLPRSGITYFGQSESRTVAGDISEHFDFDNFVKLIEGSRKVITDRAHVAILATILGKNTTLYTNSYYKNKGIYEYSLACYPNVKFVDAQRNSKEFMATVRILLSKQVI